MRISHWLSLPALLLALTISGAQTSNDFTRARLAIHRQLQDKSPAVRLNGLMKLQEYPVVDAARMAVPLYRDPDDRVRQAALATLSHLQNDPQVAAWMANFIKHDLTESTAVWVGVLFSGEAERRDVLDNLNKLFKKQPVKLLHLLPLADELGGWQDPAAVRALSRLARLELFARYVGFQRHVVKGLIAVRHKDAVAALIDLMGRLEGELLAQASDHLASITGQDHGEDVKAWAAWWAENRNGFRYPDPRALPAARARPERPSYYNIPIRARRLAFVLDTSGSMVGPRLAAAKKELIAAIEKLPERSEFNIVTYNSAVTYWSPKLVLATDDAKKKAIRYVHQLVAEGSTATYDALRWALEMKIEALYLLTDGAPTSGQIVAPDAILAAVREQNRLRGVAIHVIGIAPGPDTAIFSRFLQALAANNHGEYRKVE